MAEANGTLGSRKTAIQSTKGRTSVRPFFVGCAKRENQCCWGCFAALGLGHLALFLVQRLTPVERMAEANKAFSHFAWSSNDGDYIDQGSN